METQAKHIPNRGMLPSRIKLMRRVHVSTQVFWVQAFFLVVTLALLGLTYVGKGTQVYSKDFDEVALEAPEQSVDEGQDFTIDGPKVLGVTVRTLASSSSWVWVRVLLLDDQDRIVHTIDSELYNYGDYDDEDDKQRELTTYVRVAPGTYRVVAFGHDTSGGEAGTIDQDERVRVSVSRGMWLSRYFIALAALLFVVMMFRASRASPKDDLPDLSVLDPGTRSSIQAAGHRHMAFALVLWGSILVATLVASMLGAGLADPAVGDARGEPMVRRGGVLIIYSGGTSGGHGSTSRMYPGGPGAGK